MAARRYRAPELIVLDPNYDQSVDMWGLGCVLYEMIYVSSTYCNLKGFKAKKRFAHKGDSCFPLSPVNVQ